MLQHQAMQDVLWTVALCRRPHFNHSKRLYLLTGLYGVTPLNGLTQTVLVLRGSVC